MKKLLTLAVLVCLLQPTVGVAQEVGSYPNAGPLTGTERILADQAATYPCTGCTVNLTPAQITAFLLQSGTLFPAYASGYLFWNGTALVWATAGTGTVNGGTSGQLAYYATSSNAVSGETTLTAAQFPALSGDCTTPGASLAVTCIKTGGTPFGTFSTQNFATPPAIGGTTPAAGSFSSLTDTGITGSTQCLHVNTSGLLSGTGSDCGSGGGSGAFSALTSGTNTSAAMLVGTGASLGTTGSGTITPSAISLTATGAGGVVASGTSGQIYTSAGGSAAPTWQTAATLNGLTADTSPAGGDLLLIYSQGAAAPESITNSVLFGSPPAIGGTTPAAGSFSSLTDTGITGSTQCLHVNTSGLLSGTGSDCGSGGGSGAFSALTSGTNTIATMTAGTGSTLTYSGSGVINANETGGTAFGTFATANAATPPAIGGTTPAAGTFSTLSFSPISVATAPANGGYFYAPSSINVTDTSGTGGTISQFNLAKMPQANLETTTNTTYNFVVGMYLPAPSCSTGGGGTPTCGTLFSLYAGGEIFSAGLMSGQGGANFFGGTVTFNNNSNNATNINLGTSTGTISLGGGANEIVLGSYLDTASTSRAVNTGTASDTLAAKVQTTYESANTASSAFTVTLAAPAGDGERRRICFKNLTGTITWTVTSPATATSGFPATLGPASGNGMCFEMVYNSASGTPTNAPATTWLPY